MPDDTPGFSVVIPAYRAAAYIIPTLESVAAQTLLPREVLIYEDGHLDDLAERVAQFSQHAPFPIRLFGTTKNEGVSRARNHLIRESTSEHLAFLDADDIWESNHLALASNVLAEGADVVFSGASFIDSQGKPIGQPVCPNLDTVGDFVSALYHYNFVQCPSTLCLRRASLLKVGLFDETLTYGEDLDLWLRLIAAGAEFKCTGVSSCRYRKHRASAMAQTRTMIERMSHFYEKHLNNPLVPRAQRTRALSDALRNLSIMYARDDAPRALGAMKRLLQVEPWRPRNVPAYLWVLWNSRRLLLRRSHKSHS